MASKVPKYAQGESQEVRRERVRKTHLEKQWHKNKP